MDMDPKTNDGDATSNNNDQDGPNGNNGGDGMQEQLEHFDAIQIGSMNVKLTPSGSSPFDSNLSKKDPFFMSLFHVENLPLDDKICTDFGANSMLMGSFSGLHSVGPRVAGMHVASAQCCSLHVPLSTGTSASCSRTRQGEQRSSGQPASACRMCPCRRGCC
jgi:hypothetical protein